MLWARRCWGVRRSRWLLYWKACTVWALAGFLSICRPVLAAACEGVDVGSCLGWPAGLWGFDVLSRGGVPLNPVVLLCPILFLWGCALMVAVLGVLFLLVVLLSLLVGLVAVIDTGEWVAVLCTGLTSLLVCALVGSWLMWTLSEREGSPTYGDSWPDRPSSGFGLGCGCLVGLVAGWLAGAAVMALAVQSATGGEYVGVLVFLGSVAGGLAAVAGFMSSG